VRTISWSKLLKSGIVKIVTFRGEIGWSDGFVLEVAEVPEQMKKLRDFAETRRDDPINADDIAPQLDPDAPVVEPLCTVKAGSKHGTDIVYLSNLRSHHAGEPLAETTLNKKYVDYFVKRYPYPWLKFFVKGKGQVVTVVHTAGHVSARQDKVVGLIMPMFVDPALIDRCRKFMQPDAPPPFEPPVQPPPSERPLMSTLEQQYSVKALQDMARAAGLSPAGDKRRLIRELLRAGKLS